MSEGQGSHAPAVQDHHAGEPRSPRDDLTDGVVWLALGVAIVIGSWRMDRLEAQGINPYTVPGLVPGLLGLAMVLLSAVMVVRGLRQGGLKPQPPVASRRLNTARVATVIGLCVAFAAGLVGHGLPFWLAATIFVSTAIVVLRFGELRANGQLARGVVTALAIGLGTGIIVSLVFEKFFFVRLP